MYGTQSPETLQLQVYYMVYTTRTEGESRAFMFYGYG